MIKTTSILMEELQEYSNPIAKIQRLINEGELVSVVRGVYETDPSIPGHYLASIIYGPSYLSFEFALAYYSLIPEAVYNFTSATFNKRRMKRYDTAFGIYTYRDVPSYVYPYGINLHNEMGYSFQIASPQKAICDQLYIVSPRRNKKELEELLFEDLRIDKNSFFELNMDELFGIASCYHTQNHKLLSAYIKRSIKNGTNN